jgi:hypothetical protein
MDQAEVTERISGRAYFSEAELCSAIDALTRTELLKLGLIADFLCSGTGLEKDDLVQEPIVRALEGRRPWPKDVALMPFLADRVPSRRPSQADNQELRTPVGGMLCT